MAPSEALTSGYGQYQDPKLISNSCIKQNQQGESSSHNPNTAQNQNQNPSPYHNHTITNNQSLDQANKNQYPTPCNHDFQAANTPNNNNSPYPPLDTAAATVQSEDMIQLRIRVAVLENELQHARQGKEEVVNSNTVVVRALASYIGQQQPSQQSQKKLRQNPNQTQIPPLASASTREHGRPGQRSGQGQPLYVNIEGDGDMGMGVGAENGMLEEMREEIKELRTMNAELLERVASLSGALTNGKAQANTHKTRTQTFTEKKNTAKVRNHRWSVIDPRHRAPVPIKQQNLIGHEFRSDSHASDENEQNGNQTPKVMSNAANFCATDFNEEDEEDDDGSVEAGSLTEPNTPPHWKPNISQVDIVGDARKEDDVFAPTVEDIGIQSLEDLLRSPLSAVNSRSLSPTPVPLPPSPIKAKIKEEKVEVDLSRFAEFKFPSPKVHQTGFEIDSDKVVRGREYNFEIELKKEREKEKDREHLRLLQRARFGSPPRMRVARALGGHHVTRDYNRLPANSFNSFFDSSLNFCRETCFDLPPVNDQTGLWASREEREAVIWAHKRLAGKSETLFPEFFRYGIRYMPAEHDGNYLRTVVISDLPKDIDLRDVLARVRGGEIVSAVLMDTMKLTGGMSAMVSFVAEGAAAEYVEYTTAHSTTFISSSASTPQEARTSLLPTPSFPIPAWLRRRIFEDRKTRCLEIPNFPAQDTFIDSLVYDIACRNAHRASALIDYRVDEEGTLRLEFASIEMADSAARILRNYNAYAGRYEVLFVKDPCGRPLSDLLAPSGPRKVHPPRPTATSSSLTLTNRSLATSSSFEEERVSKATEAKQNFTAPAEPCATLNIKHINPQQEDVVDKKDIKTPSFCGSGIGSASWADEVIEAASAPPTTPSPQNNPSPQGTPTPIPPIPMLAPALLANQQAETPLLPNLGGFRKPPGGLASSKYATVIPSFFDYHAPHAVAPGILRSSSKLRDGVSASEGRLIDTSVESGKGEGGGNEEMLREVFGVVAVDFGIVKGESGKEGGAVGAAQAENPTFEVEKRDRNPDEISLDHSDFEDAAERDGNVDERENKNPEGISLPLSDDEEEEEGDSTRLTNKGQ